MNQINGITFTPPLGRAWRRMKSFLFQPLDLGRWFVVGFSAFLASLGEGFGNGSHDRVLKISDRVDRDYDGDWSDSLTGLGDWLVSEAWLVLLAGFLLLVGIVLAILCLWLSSRGRFMFLDNLVTGRAEVKKPWQEFSEQGNSLFRWQLVFSLVCLLVFGLFAGILIILFVPMGIMGVNGVVAIPLAILAGSLGFSLLVTVTFIDFFLHNFVVTIMYRERISTTEAWSRFKPLFSQNPGSFVAYGLFYLLVAIAGGIAFVLGGLATCCIGLILLMLPYIGSVISLPLTTMLRYWDLEFLGQFGPQYQVLGPPPADPDHNSIYGDGNGTVVGPEDLGEDPGGSESGSEGS